MIGMRIFSKSTWQAACEEYPAAASALKAWYAEALKANWRTPQDVKEQYSVTASIVSNNRVVFNIVGNEYRLITGINYQYGAVYIKFFGTHREYDKVDATTVEQRK